MLELWPYTNFHDLNLDWIIKVAKEMKYRMDHWDEALKDIVIDILSDHPEWIQNWMLEDDSVTREKLADGISDFIEIRYDDVRVDTQSGGRTTVYYAIIPREYKPSLHIGNDMIDTTELAANQALDTFATVSINAGLFNTSTGETRGFVIQDGVMRNDDYYINGETGAASIYMDPDGALHTLVETASAADAMATGAEWMVRGWYPIVENGIYVAGGHADDTYFPRSWIAQDASGNYLVGVCGGYEDAKGDRGMNLRDIYHFCMYDAGFIPYFLYNLDGGASSSLCVNGVRVNRVEGSEERAVANTIQFVKPNAAKIENASRTGFATARALGRVYKYLYDFVTPMMEIRNVPRYAGDYNMDLDTFYRQGLYEGDTNLNGWPSAEYGFLWITRRGRLVNQVVHAKDGLYVRELYLNSDEDAVQNVEDWVNQSVRDDRVDFTGLPFTTNSFGVLKKQGHQVTMIYEGTTNGAVADYGCIGIIPDGYRPPVETRVNGFVGTTEIKIYITASGYINVRTPLTSGQKVQLTFTYWTNADEY